MELKPYVRNGPDAADDSLSSRVLALCLWHRVWLYAGFVLVSVVVAWATPIAPWFWGYCVGATTIVVGIRLLQIESLRVDFG
jgi:hypothetical protein